MEPSYVHTIWADDIRHEAGNKVSLMGIYAHDIVVPALPTVLPRLLCYTTLVMPIERRPKRLIFRLLMDDTVLVEHTAENVDVVAPAPPPGRPVTKSQLTMAMVMSPIELPAGARMLCSQVDVDGEVLNGGKLWVTVGDPAQFGASPVVPASP